MSNQPTEPPDDEVEQVMAYIFGDHGLPVTGEAETESFVPVVRKALFDIHIQNSQHAIRLPEAHGAFPGDLLARIPPVVPDTNRLRDDILYACGQGRRTTLVNAANAGLLRMFCAQHVLDEIFEHSAEWTAGTAVSQAAYLDRWLTDYLPLIRVIQDRDVPITLLSPEERSRIETLQAVDPDDVPSAVLALTLGAFYLTNDRRALRAVYGPDVDLTQHSAWIDVLKAGGDASELGQMIQVGGAIVGVMAQGAGKGVAQLWNRFGMLGVLPLPLLALGLFHRMRDETKASLASAFWTVLTAFVEIVGEYQSLLRRFEQASPATPSWECLAETTAPADVLARGCFGTLARVGLGNCSAKELHAILPPLSVPHGEAKVRQVLRTRPYFVEAWAGRWQVGGVAAPVLYFLRGWGNRQTDGLH